jgi:hypothetical protein
MPLKHSASDSGITPQGKGLIVGIIFVIWGLIGAVWSYYGDTDSFDIIRMNDASQNAVVRAVIWIGLGGGFIAWALISPRGSRRQGQAATVQNENAELDSQVPPQSVADWARRVAATGYVDDAEAFIKQLGGSVAYQELGEIFTHEKITVDVLGEEHSFESKYDMVQWVIKELVPKVQQGRYVVAPNQHADQPVILQTAGVTRASRRERSELIARCAAKGAGMDGFYAERYVREIRDHIVLWGQRPQASGTALPPEWGFRLRFLRDTWVFLLIFALAAAIIISVPHFWIQSLFIAAVSIGVLWPLEFADFWNWRENLRTVWSTMLPEAGTPIAADSKCLTVGATSVPWSDLRLEAAELRGVWAFSVALPQTYRVDQLRLVMGKGSFVLDVCLIKNGQEVVDTICDKLEVPSATTGHQRT